MQHYMRGKHPKRLWNSRQETAEMRRQHSVLALGKRASSFPTITRATTVLNRFLQGNLAELNSDENVSFSPSNIGDGHRDWHRKKYWRGRRWFKMGIGSNKHCKVIRQVFVLLRGEWRRSGLLLVYVRTCMAEKPTAVGVDSVDVSVKVHPKMKIQSFSTHPWKSESTAHFWSFTAKQCFSILLNNWWRLWLVLKCKQTNNKNIKWFHKARPASSKSPEALRFQKKHYIHPFLSINFHCGC